MFSTGKLLTPDHACSTVYSSQKILYQQDFCLTSDRDLSLTDNECASAHYDFCRQLV